MKKIIFLLGLIAFMSSGAIANAPEINETATAIYQDNIQDKKDCVMMIDGEMFVLKDGKKTEMLKAVIMSNGTKVLANGEVYLKDGEKLKLENGDCVYMNGKIERKEK